MGFGSVSSTLASNAAAATQAATRSLGRGSPVTIAFGGDVHFEGVLRTKLNGAPTTMLDLVKPLYAGADIMMVNLETAITIRTLVLKDGVAHIQAGAGIVADSDPPTEYQETLNKANATLCAVAEAERMERR